MEQMSKSMKREIQFKLRHYVSTFHSQKKAAATIHDCSEGTIIAMLSENEFGWDKITDAMWRNVSAQVGGVVDFSQLVETLNFHTIFTYFELAKEEGASFSLIGNAGWGKSYAAKWYSAINRKNNVYYLECAEYWNKKMFLQNLLMQMGQNCYGMGTGELMAAVVREIRRANHPLVIMDEIDKLPDAVLKFFITLYNETNKHCGYVWLSTNAIEKRIIKGIQNSTIGYQELFSRIGASFITLVPPSTDEVMEICKANGITDPQKIAVVCNEVKDLKGDLRRVDRNILKDKVKRMRKPQKAA